MRQTVEVVYLQGSINDNEDAFVMDEQNGVFSAIDGATGLGEISGKMAAQLVKNALEGLKANLTILDGLQLANEKI